MATLKKKPTGKTKIAPDELAEAVKELSNLRHRSKMLTEQVKEQQETVLALMEKGEVDTYKVKVGNKMLTATRMQNTSLVYDQKSLKKRLGSKLWDKITTKSLDKAKLEAFIASGEVKAADVAACAEEKKTAPFIKVT